MRSFRHPPRSHGETRLPEGASSRIATIGRGSSPVRTGLTAQILTVPGGTVIAGESSEDQVMLRSMLRVSGPSLRAVAPFGLGEAGKAMRRLLTPRQQRTLAALATRIHAEPRQILYREGAPAGSIFICGEGALKAFRDLPSGKRRILAFMFADDACGLAENGRYVNTVQTLSKATCYRISIDALVPVLQQDAELQWQFLCKITHELRESQRRALVVGRRSAAGRFAMFLKMLERRIPERAKHTISLPMNRSEIADYLGLSLESVSRATRQLAREKIIEFHGVHEVRVLDRPKLERLASNL
jgi:CRP-like cAMP-binding protein